MTFRAWFMVALVGGLGIGAALQFLPGGSVSALVGFGVFGLTVVAYSALQVLALTRAQSNRFPHSGFVRRAGAGFVLRSNGHVEMRGVAAALWFPVSAAYGILMLRGVNDSDPPDLILRYIYALGLVVLAVGAGVLVLYGIIVVRGGPSVALSPAGIMARSPLGTWHLGWPALDPQAPVTSVAMPMGSVRFAITDPSKVRDTGLPLWQYRVNWQYRGLTPEQFAEAVTYYVQQPQARDAIGTDAELARLNAALGLTVPA